MRKPYIFERKKIARAQCEDRRDGLEVDKYRHDRERAEKGGDSDGKETED